MADFATVLEAKVTGEPGRYTFTVKIASPDTGCDRYADWWEVISPEGELLYRRILAHSHVDEQPFARSGGPVPVQPDQPILIRAHMNEQGYGNQVLQGTVAAGFTSVTLANPPAPDLASQLPLPRGCEF
ncbi:MAG: hypothetical protein ACFCVD_13640 [Nodosilinea sp.]